MPMGDVTRAEELGLDPLAFEKARNVFILADGRARRSDVLADVIGTYIKESDSGD